LNLAGQLVCRRCYYAEQTMVQDQRVAASDQQIGVFDAFHLGRRLLFGCLLLLIGGPALLGALRSGAFRAAGWSALLVALGVTVITLAIRAARRPKD